MKNLNLMNVFGFAATAAIVSCLALAAATEVQAANVSSKETASQRAQSWSEAIAKMPTPRSGCFKAAFPSKTWTQVDCVKAPARPYIPVTGSHGSAETTGDGHDYAAVTASLTSSAVGYFPVITGLKTETGYGGRANYYSLQLNSNFMSNDPACSGSSNPANCLGWEQFVYSSSENAGFMQYWLINYAATCPSGWYTYSSDCYKNSSAVRVPLQVIKQLKNLKLSGTAVNGGTDTLVLTTRTQAYSTTGQDSVVYLADGWTGSEFNIVGDGSGSAANFNAGTSLTVEIDLTDGNTNAPTCQSNDGTTGETNNLNLGGCSVAGGSTPYVRFTESLAK